MKTDSRSTNRIVIVRFANAGIYCGLLVCFFSTAGPVFGQEPRLEIAAEVLDGDAPGIKVTGLSEKSEASLHVVRRLSRYETDDSGNWQQAFKVLHAWATFSANAPNSLLREALQHWQSTITLRTEM